MNLKLFHFQDFDFINNKNNYVNNYITHEKIIFISSNNLAIREEIGLVLV